jgi:hypothetical protein
LIAVKALVDRLAGQCGDLLVRVAEPARRGGIAGIAGAEEFLFALGARRCLLAEELESLVRRQCIGDVAEGDEADDFFGREIGQQLPDRLADGLGPEVPQRVDQRSGRQMQYAFFRTDPAELTVVGEAIPVATEVGDDLLEPLADDERSEGVDGGDAELVAAADGEGETVPFQTGGIGVEDDVGGRIVGVRMHGVGTGQGKRGGEAHIEGLDLGDRGGHRTPPLVCRRALVGQKAARSISRYRAE